MSVLSRDAGSHDFEHNVNLISQQGLEIKFIKNWLVVS